MANVKKGQTVPPAAPRFTETVLAIPKGDIEFDRIDVRMRDPEF